MRQGRRFVTTATSVVDLMLFAYGVHPKQIANAPAWFETDKFEVTMLQAGEGQPSDAQLKAMMRKLLSVRVGLTLHREKRELSVFRLVTLKGGPKLADTLTPDAPAGWGSGGRPGMLVVKSSTLADVAGFLQRFFDPGRPVIDRTGLSGKYDFTLRWTPDTLRNRGGVADEFPDLFAAIEQQLGLKLESATESVEVLVIDNVTRPTEN
jgi:bla regulator protein blaR1